MHRFSATERWLHWIHGGSFLLMLATGLVLFLPQLAGVVGNRPLVKGAHLVVAVLWLTGLALVMVLGDRRITGRTWRQFLALRSDDLRWLTSQAARDVPQGRFNGGQKVHGLIQGALTVLFFVSGTLLYLGERNHALRAPGSLALHDAAMLIGIVFVAGHIWIALRPGTRDSLSGMTDGTVPGAYASDHHARWDPANEPVEHRPALTPARFTAAMLIAAAGVTLAWLIA
ncbi:MAG: cytochrome b/b6 domain-containing protein [Solirubrobacteraceae bacterium]|nr:cytochrome b/b6 domain-containing protein [Solirubrobacteraceae bacterium]